MQWWWNAVLFQMRKTWIHITMSLNILEFLDFGRPLPCFLEIAAKSLFFMSFDCLLSICDCSFILLGHIWKEVKNILSLLIEGLSQLAFCLWNFGGTGVNFHFKISFSFSLAEWGFEFRTSSLLGRYSASWAQL
jgi:hypothetical protein